MDHPKTRPAPARATTSLPTAPSPDSQPTIIDVCDHRINREGRPRSQEVNAAGARRYEP